MSSSKFSKIAQIIEERIENGEYLLNSKLPTHRVLADELNTTPVTIAKAYKLLSNKGKIESFVGRGSFVCGESNLNSAIKASEMEETFNFSILQPCLYKNVVPLQKAYQVASEKLTASLIGYTEHTGHENHREAGVAWAKYFGLTGGSVDNTLLTNGAQHALSLLIHALTKPGDTIAVEEKTYPGTLAIASLSGRKVVKVSMDEHGVSPEALELVIDEWKPKLVVIVPSHQNPTGITMPEVRRRKVAEVIKRKDIWLVEDDIYCFLDERPIPAISNFIPEKAFHISALSKALSPAMRCGYIKAPESHVELLNAHIRANIWLSPPINYIAATYLIESGEAFKIAEQQRKTAFERQTIARKILPTIQCRSTGYHIWLPLPLHWTSERFVAEAKNRHVIISSGSYFDATGHESRHVRLSLMSISSEAQLEEGLRILQNLLESKITTFPF
ncbi:PLP-dependent aminotransferase family protein [Vibrio rumoiensis]|uniref:GntR family transcriptional regulator n=1 Tax=Vibrio rumoiensis 1S-45 TaxID=1188252 RepID=A0A1E5E4X1_9VIBR|nr:PLP-dependent aminotransferase family protein [Vibrio rumoiensis]OEF28184.1 GntR family transcriptional regulator [Vibrio rumoiensis 1S-45]